MVAFYNPGDQKIYEDFQYVPQEKYRTGFTAPTTSIEEEVTETSGIPATNAFTKSGGGYYAGPYSDLIQDYNTTTKDRYFSNQDTPLVDGLYQTKVGQTFMGLPSYRQQELTGADLGEYIGTNTDVPLEQTMAGRIQSGLGNFKNKASNFMGNIKGFGPLSFALNAMDQFSSLPATDQQFINMNMGYTGPTVFGENNSGLSKDPFGINTRSAFGNYADYVKDYETDYTEEELEKFSNLKQKKIGFYKQKQKELIEIEKAAQEEKDRVAGVQKDLDTGSYVDRDTSGMTASDRAVGGGAGVAGLGPSAEDRGSRSAQGYSQHAKGGRVGYFYGGLASIL